ncbi:HAD family hydrolase [Mucilaginibacter antarcticus]|uniref:HAD family hydrolase n=1 Tax=Mucilaginibacter antarcticus TaxID=1855725 RepID=A0ABW5XRB9_9SPHI
MLLNAGYQHFSFDLWLTLIRSNPAFKQERAKCFYQHFNFRNKPLDEVVAVFRQVDLMCNLINEKTGKNIDADEMYLMVLSIINDGDSRVWGIDIAELYADMEALVFKYLPVAYCDETIGALAHIKQQTGGTIGILSNTGFIRGVTLRKVLHQIGISEHVDFQLYSDETGMSKPNSGFFNLMLEELKAHHTEIDLKRVIHIGDNPIADIAGAQAVGIQSLLINSNNRYLPGFINNAYHLLAT